MPQSEIDRHAGYVTALGQRSDIPSLLRVADVFAFPTEYREGVPARSSRPHLLACPSWQRRCLGAPTSFATDGAASWFRRVRPISSRKEFSTCCASATSRPRWVPAPRNW